ncbi:MAG: hypothetical protein OHK0050_38640 [Roseiflexaceae bacterium]
MRYKLNHRTNLLCGSRDAIPGRGAGWRPTLPPAARSGISKSSGRGAGWRPTLPPAAHSGISK